MANTYAPAPTRQPQYDRSGNMTPAWVTYYQRRDRAVNDANASLDQVTAEIAALQDKLAGLVATTREIRTKLPLTGGGDLSADRELSIRNFGGDAGRGGTAGAVPAPNAGDAAAKRFLSADGTWAKPAADANVTAGYGIEATDLGGVATEITAPALAGDTPRDFTEAIEDLRAQQTDAGNALGFQQQLDELRVLLASVPTPAPPLSAASFDSAGAAAAAQAASLQKSANLSDVASAAAALANLIGSFGTWTPSFSANGSMTVSGVSNVGAQYLRIGPWVLFTLQGSCTLGGSASYQIYFTLPVAVVAGGVQWACPSQITSPGWQIGISSVGFPSSSQGAMAISPLGTNLVLGSCSFLVSGLYRCA